MSGVSLEKCLGVRRKNLGSWRIGNRESLKDEWLFDFIGVSLSEFVGIVKISFFFHYIIVLSNCFLYDSLTHNKKTSAYGWIHHLLSHPHYGVISE